MFKCTEESGQLYQTATYSFSEKQKYARTLARASAAAKQTLFSFKDSSISRTFFGITSPIMSGLTPKFLL